MSLDTPTKKQHKRFDLTPIRPEEDWTCTECSAHCFASKPTCFKCGASRDGNIKAGKHRRREGVYKPSATTAPYEDMNVTCKDCSQDFVFTAGEQEYFAKKGFIGKARTRCSACAKRKKQKWGVEAESNRSSKSGGGGGRPTCGGKLICFGWQKGSCTHGDACKFAHGEPDGVLEVARTEASSESKIRCFNCNQVGHRVRDCPKSKPSERET